MRTLSTRLVLLAAICSSISAQVTWDVTWGLSQIHDGSGILEIAPGDSVRFLFAASAHNVYEMPDLAALTSCDFSAATQMSTGVDDLTLGPFFAGPERHFACEVSNHCSTHNMKLTVRVVTAISTDMGTNMMTTPEPAPAHRIRVDWIWGFQDNEQWALPGDVIEFIWSGTHNVYMMTDKEAYEQCDFENATYLGSMSGVNYTYTGGTVYFACEVGPHCASGNMKVVFRQGHPVELDWNWGFQDNFQKALVGDIIIFKWEDVGVHDVYMMPDYYSTTTCDFENATKLGDMSPVRYTFTGETVYFACSLGNQRSHCNVGGMTVEFSQGTALTIDWVWALSNNERTNVIDDFIIFEWDTYYHNVFLLPDRAAYDSCDFTAAEDLGDMSPVRYRYAGGQVYFACEVSVHCDPLSAGGGNMKISISDGTSGGSDPGFAGDTTLDVPDCQEMSSWKEIAEMRRSGNACTGGLGNLMTADYEVWVCLKNNVCLSSVGADQSDWACYVYHENDKKWIHWGLNSVIKLIDDPNA